MVASRMVILGLVTLTAAPRAFAERPNTDIEPLPPAIAVRVDHLDAPDWETRDRATFELMEADPAYLDALRRRSQEGLSTEAGLRLKRIAKELFLSKRIGPAQACLGIQHTRSIGWRQDSRVAPGLYALRIDTVFPSTAAARAGLKPGDLIIGMNGKLADSETEADSFTGWIFNQKPGTPCSFTILRDIDARLVRPEHERGIDRRGVRGLDTRVVNSSEDDRLPAGGVGLRITSSRNADARLRFEPGDLIVGIDGEPLPLHGAKEALTAWAEAAPVDDMQNPIPRRNLRRGVLVREFGPSLQVLRGGRRMEIDVTLGRWPLYIVESGRAGTRRGARIERIRDIASEFEHWWVEPVVSESHGRLPARDPSLYWQMEP